MKIRVTMTSEQALIYESEGKKRILCVTTEDDISECKAPLEYCMQYGKWDAKEFFVEDEYPFFIVRRAFLQHIRICDVVFCFLLAMDTELRAEIRKEAIRELTYGLRDKRVFKAIRRNVDLRTMAKISMKHIPLEWYTPNMWSLVRVWKISVV